MNARIYKLILILLVSTCAYTQEMVYLGHGKISLNNQIIKKPRQLKKNIQKQNSKELMLSYKKYIRLRRFEKVFLAVGGFGFIYAVENEFTAQPKINFKFLSLGLTSSLVAELFHRPANRALKEIVELYNEEVYFQPILRKEEK
jgi:hypothetical protein